MESKHGSENDKHPSKGDDDSIDKDDVLSPLISVGESDHDSGSEAGDLNIDEKTPGSSKKSRSSHHASSSSSSSESSSDFFHMDEKVLKKSSTFPVVSPEAQKDSPSPKKKEKNDTPGDMASKSEDLNTLSPSDASSQVSPSISNPTSQTMSPVPSPPKQMMERSGEYDPKRIPDAVFGSRPSSAMEWSTTSNDSLFSLNFGNNSFSRDQFLMSGEMFGEDIHKSGELYHSEELIKLGEEDKFGLPPLGKLRKVKTMEVDRKSLDADKSKQTKDMDADQFEKVKRELDRNGSSSMRNRPSDASASSSHSFAFPILVDATKSTSVEGPFSRKQDPKLDVYQENSQTKTHKKKSPRHSRGPCCSCYYCSLPECSCPSSQHCWKWFKKWCCCFWCCHYCYSPQCSCPSSRHCWSWKSCCCCCYLCCG